MHVTHVDGNCLGKVITSPQCDVVLDNCGESDNAQRFEPVSVNIFPLDIHDSVTVEGASLDRVLAVVITNPQSKRGNRIVLHPKRIDHLIIPAQNIIPLGI